MPKVSVIIPNYNHAKYLRQRIASVLNQTYQDFELIILDDFSTDDSKQIIESYRNHPTISKIEFNDKNSGSTFKQWEKGIGFAKGDLIWIAESDDFCEPEFLETLVPMLENNSSVGLAYCLTQEVDENSKIISENGWWTKDLDAKKWSEDHIQYGRDACRDFFVYKNIILNASAVVFRKSFFSAVSEKITSMKMCGDQYFWITILMQSDYAYTAKNLNYQRSHSNTTRNLNSFEKGIQKNKEDLIVHYLLKKYFGDTLPKIDLVREKFINWIVLNEKKKKWSSIYKLPPFYKSNWADYFFLTAKLMLYPLYALIKPKNVQGN